LNDAVLAPLSFLVGQHVRAVAGGWIVATYLEPAPGADWRAIATACGATSTARRRRVGAGASGAGARRCPRREVVAFVALAILGNFVLLLWSSAHRRCLRGLAPAVFALITICAVMGATGTALDPVNLIVAPLILGIGADYGCTSSPRRVRDGNSAGCSLDGPGDRGTSLTTMAGFGFLGLSRYPALATMGCWLPSCVSLCSGFDYSPAGNLDVDAPLGRRSSGGRGDGS